MVKLFTILFFLLPTLAFSQKLVTKEEIGLQAIAGFSRGMNQAILHHHWGQGIPFIDQDNAWMRKYKNWPHDKRERFLGSKSIFAFATDAFHLTQFVDRTATLITIAIVAHQPKQDWKRVVLKALILAATNSAMFFVSYNLLFLKPK